MLNLRQFRSKATSYSDLLNFALLPDNGIHQGKDGSLLAAWYYRGQDMGHCTQLELAATAAQLNRALTRLGSGWMLHVDAIRRYSVGYPTAQACHFPDRTSLVVDAERRVLYDAQGKHLESIYALSLTYLPPGKIENKIVSMLYEDVETEGADNGTAARILATFKRQIAEVEETFASVLPMRRMLAQAVDKDADGRVIYHDELLRYFELTCSGEDRPVRLPPIPMYLDAIIGCHSFVGGVQPKVGSRFVKVVAIDGYPQESLPGILSALDALDFPYRWNTRFIFLDPHQAKAVLERHRKKWQQKQRGLKDQVLQTSRGAVNIDAVRMTSDAEEAMGEADSGLVKYGFLTTTIVITDEDLTIAGERAEAVRKLISDIGFSARIEDVNAVEAFLGSIPSHGFPNVRRAVVHTLNLADMLPITAVWAGPERHPCDFYPPNSPPLAYGHTTGSTPMRLALHVGDVGHTLIAGFTGGGKSTLMRFFEIQHLRYKDAQVFSFDKGYSGYVQCNAVGGSYYDIGGPDAKLTFCPLKDVDQPEDRAWAAEWIETLLALQQVSVTPHQRNLIFQALERVGQATSRTMTEFVSELQDQTLRDALQHYTLSGASGDLFDSATDSLGTNNYQVFEMEHVMGSGEKNVIPLLLYLFRQIEKRLDGRPTLVTLDEVWLMLSHPMFAEKIREWLKTLRKKNAAVVMATQELSDFFNSPIRDTILSNCLTKILLPNKEAKSPTARPGYEAIGLNERELDILSTATPKRHYYYRSPLGRRLFGLGLGPVALSFVAVSDPAEIKIARGMIKEHGQEWPARWLERRGLNDWALYWRQVTQ